MFLHFKKIIKMHNARGWSLQKSGDRYYLSKFDNGINDDEYRIFLEQTPDSVIVTHAEKLKINYRTGDSKTTAVSLNHKLVKEAQLLVDDHPLNKKHIHNLKRSGL